MIFAMQLQVTCRSVQQLVAAAASLQVVDAVAKCYKQEKFMENSYRLTIALNAMHSHADVSSKCPWE